ncbi:MAG: hypothetical protein R2747_02440 [Pyrinomonadaceae bacterium]
MKKLLVKTAGRKWGRINLLLVLAVLLAVGLGCEFEYESSGDGDDSAQFEKVDYQELVRLSMVSFRDALEEEDFSGFLANASGPFRRSNSNQDMKRIFRNFILQKKALLPIFAKIERDNANFIGKSKVRSEDGFDKVLIVEGNYRVGSTNVNFSNKFIRENGRWKIHYFYIHFD